MPTSLMRTTYTYYSAIPGYYYPVTIYSEYGEEVENTTQRQIVPEAPLPHKDEEKEAQGFTRTRCAYYDYYSACYMVPGCQ